MRRSESQPKPILPEIRFNRAFISFLKSLPCRNPALCTKNFHFFGIPQTSFACNNEPENRERRYRRFVNQPRISFWCGSSTIIVYFGYRFLSISTRSVFIATPFFNSSIFTLSVSAKPIPTSSPFNEKIPTSSPFSMPSSIRERPFA